MNDVLWLMCYYGFGDLYDYIFVSALHQSEIEYNQVKTKNQ